MRRMAALMMALAVLACATLALAEAREETVIGYFDKVMYVREKPESSHISLATIPAYCPVTISPIDDRYATIEFEGVSGYIFYRDLLPLPEETPVEAFTVYLEENKYFYDTPLHSANILTTMQAETPMTVVATVRNYYHVKAGELEGYVFQTDCTRLTAFPSQPANEEFYVAAKEALRGYPLKNAEAVATLEPGRIYQATALSRGFYQVTAEGVTGWVPAGRVSTFQADASVTRVALMRDGVKLYIRPDKGFAAESGYEGGEKLAFISAENNGFYRLEEGGLYVSRDDVETFAVTKAAMQQLVVSTDVELMLRPTGVASGVKLEAGELYASQYTVGDAYLVFSDEAWGFLPKTSASVSSLEADEEMNRRAAMLTQNATMYSETGRRAKLREGDKVFALAEGSDFYRCEVDGETGYIFKDAVALYSADAPLTPYTVTVGKDIQFMDFPDKALTAYYPAIPAGATVEVNGFNRCYLRVTYKGRTGYALQEGLVTAESEGIPTSENVPSYQVALDKSTFMAYVFLLDDQGKPSAVVMSAQVGIGKRSTPTPSGVFTLGVKERWHAFTYSYTPHTTTYVKARFIHGIPCRTRDESTKIGYMERYGTITGGCLRSPMEFARFVYMNCPSYETQLVVVSGGLEVPEKTVTPEEIFAAMREAEAATATDIASPTDL